MSTAVAQPCNCEQLKKLIREVPDFPKKGILFYDITTLLKDKPGFATLIDTLSEHYIEPGHRSGAGHGGARIHLRPGAGLSSECRIRSRAQAGQASRGNALKLDYALEYGTNTLEIHKDAIQKGQRVLIVDDLLATGGTAEATAKLAESLGAEIAGLGFVVELDFLKGRDKLKGYDVISLLHYDK